MPGGLKASNSHFVRLRRREASSGQDVWEDEEFAEDWVGDVKTKWEKQKKKTSLDGITHTSQA
jgi:hypothetical protein